jgi:formylglycine-generating enzyme required for sulfatase activity
VRAGACTPPVATTGAERSYEQADPQAPVVFVTGLQAAEFCAWLGRRLPTDAEWERAARGSDGRRWPSGRRPRQADVNIEGSKGLAPVEDQRFSGGSTEHGLTHMVGNAAEWTGTPDNCPPNPYGCATRWEGPKPATLILRGGGFIDPAMPLDGSDSDISDSGEKWNSVGFRCARSQ